MIIKSKFIIASHSFIAILIIYYIYSFVKRYLTERESYSIINLKERGIFNMTKRLFKKSDLFILIPLLLLALGLHFFLSKSSGDTVEISVEGEVLYTLPLSEELEVVLDNGVTIFIDGESAFFRSSDCPDKVCVNTGRLSRSGEWAACLPNKTVIKISGREGGADTVS